MKPKSHQRPSGLKKTFWEVEFFFQAGKNTAKIRGEFLGCYKKSNFTVYPFERRRKRVDVWTFLLDYVRVGHRKLGDQKVSPSGHKIPTGLPEGGVSTSKSTNFTSE